MFKEENRGDRDQKQHECRRARDRPEVVPFAIPVSSH